MRAEERHRDILESFFVYPNHAVGSTTRILADLKYFFGSSILAIHKESVYVTTSLPFTAVSFPHAPDTTL